LHNITRPVEGKSPSALLVTSALVSEGKSTIAAYLAITSACHGRKKTLLIDCDLRRPTIHKLFGLPIEHGVADVVRGNLSVEGAYKQVSLKRLQILTAGKVSSNPVELFEGEEIIAVIEEAKFHYDLVIVDTAPVIPVSDPALLSQAVDGVVLVVKAGSTPREVVKRACDILTKGQAKIVGIALNNAQGVLPYHYNYPYYKHYHSEK
jgi:capsular exopolysaccharide synthesis family protein